MASLYRYRFGNVVFDESKLELVVGGLPVDAQPLPLQILALLLSRGGEVVSRDELFDIIWHGRRTVDNVLANAVTKLRNALGEPCATFIENLPRVGYRFAGRFERTAVGRLLVSRLHFKAGDKVPLREGLSFERLLGQSDGQEVWLAVGARGPGGGAPGAARRVYKFAADSARVAALKREVRIGRLLRDELGERPDMVPFLGWNFDQPPYFVESAFGGDDLLAWAEAGDRLATMSTPDRLALLLQIGDAVAAAHSVGVLHKDIKPKNVVVDGSTAPWQIRLIDFGSGKLLDSERLLRLGITSMGMTAGAAADESTRSTPLYMAPELLRDQPATVRSDLYALGVLCYQLVVGDLRKPLVPGWEADVTDELLREDIARACHGKAESRFSGVDEFVAGLRRLNERTRERAAHAAAQRQAERDLEALRQARARRPWVAATIGALAVGLAVSVGLYLKVRAARDAEAREYATARTLNTFLTRDFIALADPSTAGRRDITVIEAARGAAAKIDSTFAAEDPLIRAGLHASMQLSLHGLSDYEGAVSEGRKALEAFAAAGGVDPRIVDVRLQLAYDLSEFPRVKECAEQLAAVAAQIERRHLEQTAIAARYWWVKAGLDLDAMEIPKALEGFRRAWEIAQRLPDLPADTRDTIEFAYAEGLQMSARFDEAAEQAEHLFTSQVGRLGPHHPRTCHTQTFRARVEGLRHRFDAAFPMADAAAACLSTALGPKNIRTISTFNVIADLHFQKGEFAVATRAYQRVAEDYASLLGPASARSIDTLLSAAVARQYSGDTAAAERDFEANLGVAEKALGWNNPTVQGIRFHLADCRLDRRATGGVAHLLDGLSAQALNEEEIAADWDGQLAYESGRLALYSGDVTGALQLLRTAAAVVAAKPTGHLTEARVRAVIEEALKDQPQRGRS